MKMFAARRVPGARHASVKEVCELSKLSWVLDEALSNRSFEARVLPDGRVLLYWGEGQRGNLYPSREALAKMQRETAEELAKGPFDPVKELLPPIDDFLRDVEALASGLGNVIRIPTEALDRSVESLDPVDKAVVRMRRAKRMTPEVFTPVTAYVGEIMRLVCDGRWTKMPEKKRVRVENPDALWAAASPAIRVAAEQAAADVKARGGSDFDGYLARHAVLVKGAPVGFDFFPEPSRPSEPVVQAHNGALVQPVAVVIRSILEHSTYGSLRTGVEGRLAGYLVTKKSGGSAGP